MSFTEAFHILIFWLAQLNWIDWIVILISIFSMIEGYATGALSGLFDIASFLLSFTLGLKVYKPLGDFLGRYTHLSQGFSHIIGFAIAAVLAELLLRLLQNKLYEHLRKLAWLSDSIAGRFNRFLGIIPGFFSGLVLLAFLLTVMVVLPVSPSIKQAIGNAKLGSILVSQTQSFEKNLTNIFGGRSNDLLTFFTVEPEANSSVPLGFTTNIGTIDATAEDQMLILVNIEREKQGLSDLSMDETLRQVARAHSRDMLVRGYFSHYTPEGKTPFDRMTDAGISFTSAGENLAFSPNVDLAMQGLMQSPGHRANILSPNFHKAGIGVINAGIYGEMFSQEFTD